MLPQLFLWLSPSFPVGAYAYSQGLERAAEAGLVKGHEDLEGWIGDLFEAGSARTDLILLSNVRRAGSDAAGVRQLTAINALALALQPSSERYLETTQQGGSFYDAVSASWPHAHMLQCREAIPGPIAYPVAVGVAAAAHAVPLAETLSVFGLAAASNLTSAAIRLSIIGQTGAQRVLASLAPVLDKTAKSAASATLDDIATSTFSADLASLEHETQYTRLFRS